MHLDLTRVLPVKELLLYLYLRIVCDVCVCVMKCIYYVVGVVLFVEELRKEVDGHDCAPCAFNDDLFIVDNYNIIASVDSLRV